MGDSAQYLNIPASVQVAAFYGNGAYAATIAQAEARFPHAKYGRCWIDVLGTLPSAQARDWETGDKGGSLEQWVIDHNKARGKKDAVVYCNVSTIPEVRQLTGTQVLGTDYFLWVATLDGTLFGPAQYPHVIANQIKGAAAHQGRLGRVPRVRRVVLAARRPASTQARPAEVHPVAGQDGPRGPHGDSGTVGSRHPGTAGVARRQGARSRTGRSRPGGRMYGTHGSWSACRSTRIPRPQPGHRA